MSTALSLPTISDLPYHADKLPRDTAGLVEELARILGFKMFVETKKDEYVLNVLCGVMLYRHLDKPQQMDVMARILNEDHIAPVDWGELRILCTDVIVQPKWHLWALTTEELNSIFKDQKRMQEIFGLIGISFSVAFLQDMRDEYKKTKNFTRAVSKKLPIFLIIACFEYASRSSLKQTENEIDKRTGNPKSSSYYQ